MIFWPGYVEICGEGVLGGRTLVGIVTQLGEGGKLCLNFVEFGTDYFLTIF